MKPYLFFLVLVAITPSIAQSGLQGEYFDGKDFNRKVATRTDAGLDFSWLNAPIKGLTETNYSMRWTGKLYAPTTGTYIFSAKVDDGIRVWVGNKLIIESWQLNNSVKMAGKIIMEAGKYYDIRVDYFNEVLGGVIQLFWTLPNTQQPTLISPTNYFKSVPKPIEKKTIPPKAVELPKPIVKTEVPPKVVEKPKPVEVDLSEIKIVIPTQKPEAKPTATVTIEQKPEKPTATILDNVSFEQSSYVLLSQSYPALDKLVELLKNIPDKKVEIAGHTDNVGDPRLNVALSENRAKVVASYLTRKGIDEARITIRGYGGSKPINNGQSEGDRSQNRRVEFLIEK